MNSIMIVDVFSIIPLLFTIHLARRHLLTSKLNAYYIVASTLTLITIGMEIITLQMEALQGSVFIVINSIANSIGFILTPAIPLTLLFYLGAYVLPKNKQRLLMIPMGVNMLLVLISDLTGWIFTIDADNQYIRGPVFWITTVLAFFYYSYISLYLFRKNNRYSHMGKSILILVYILPIIATLLQLVFPAYMFIWSTVALSLLMFYIFSLESQFAFDIQTGIKNREAFEIEMLQFQKYRHEATLFMFDLNNLKLTNDVYGHQEGDKLLCAIADSLITCFSSLGNTYRIGGDEFCVICKKLPKQVAQGALQAFEDHVQDLNTKRRHQVEVAYGFASTSYDHDLSIYTALSNADNAMYEHKAKQKLNQT